MKRFYLARFIDANPGNQTYMAEVVRTVTSKGWSKDGFRVDRWATVFAANMNEARAKLDRGECSWES